MKRALILLLILLVIFLTGLNLYAGFQVIMSAPVTARAQVFSALPGILNASISNSIIRSNQQIYIFASTVGIATNVKIFFNHYLSQQWSLSNINPTNWRLKLKDQYPLTIQSIYTANFIVRYSNSIVTNYNKASFQVDDTPPIIVSTSPSNNSIININSWNFTNNLKDTGGARVSIYATIANSHLIYAGTNVAGTWKSNSSTQIVFSPSSTFTSNGIYHFVCYPVDTVGNTNFAMKNTNNYIRFRQNFGLHIYSCSHKFLPNTQLTPAVPLTVTVTGTIGITNVYFSVIGSKITNIKLFETPLNSGTYIGTYYITSGDYVLGGIVRGFLGGLFLDASIPIDIAPVVKAVRGKDILVVSKDDIQTRLLIPDNSLPENVTIDISLVNLFNDKVAFDFSMYGAQNNLPVEFFTKPLTVYIHYNVNNGTVNNLNIDQNSLQNGASIFYFDKVQWNKVGANFDLANQLAYASVNHFSIFALSVDNSNGKLSVHPNPFTPGSSDEFNILHFGAALSNPNQQVTIKIYSLNGFLRNTLTLNTLGAIVNNNYFDIPWNGTDSTGKNLMPGLYIYQAMVGDTRFKGTFVLAR